MKKQPNLLYCLDQPVALSEDVFPETATELGFDMGLSIRETIEQEEGKDSLCGQCMLLHEEIQCGMVFLSR